MKKQYIISKEEKELFDSLLNKWDKKCDEADKHYQRFHFWTGFILASCIMGLIWMFSTFK